MFEYYFKQNNTEIACSQYISHRLKMYHNINFFISGLLIIVNWLLLLLFVIKLKKLTSGLKLFVWFNQII